MSILQYRIATKHQPNQIEVEVQGHPEKIRIIGYDPTKQNTAYFDREVEVSPRKRKLVFPMPIAPDMLQVEVHGAVNAKVWVKKSRLKKLSRKRFNFPKNLNPFVKHALEVALLAGYQQEGMYTTDDNKYPIYLQNSIMDANGNVVNTPARTNIETGEIIVNRWVFNHLSIPIRLYILLHEYMHHYHQTLNEFFADSEALKIYLELGFPKFEAILAQGKIFWDSPEMIERLRKTQENILNYKE